MKIMSKLLSRFKPVKKNCKTCIFNADTHCRVGSHLASQGKSGICIEGELWQEKQNAVKIFTPEFLKEIGFTVVSEKRSEYHPFQIYGCAKDRIGLTHIYWNEEGCHCTYFGEALQPNTAVSIRKDADTRTVFNGYVFCQDDVRHLLRLTW